MHITLLIFKITLKKPREWRFGKMHYDLKTSTSTKCGRLAVIVICDPCTLSVMSTHTSALRLCLKKEQGKTFNPQEQRLVHYKVEEPVLESC